MALRAAFSAAVWAANGVLLRDPLNPALPALAQATTLPILSVSVTIVLLKVAWTWAIPTRTSFRSFLRPTFFRGTGGFAGFGLGLVSPFFVASPPRAAGAPRRLMILHFSHRTFTAGRTFIRYLNL